MSPSEHDSHCISSEWACAAQQNKTTLRERTVKHWYQLTVEWREPRSEPKSARNGDCLQRCNVVRWSRLVLAGRDTLAF